MRLISLASLNFVDPAPGCIYAPLGGSFDLNCTVRLAMYGDPVEFTWFQENMAFPTISVNTRKTIERKQFSVSKSGDSAKLHCTNLEEEDFGTYTCKAKNKFSEATKTFRVKKADAPVLTDVPPPVITVRLRGPLELPCILDAIPPPKISWTKDSKRLVSFLILLLFVSIFYIFPRFSTISAIRSIDKGVLGLAQKIENRRMRLLRLHKLLR
ncbi:hypothetical protein Ciccas_010550 [Cichlidogyrus casuarinus]|uniref:Ig-like domain-containing protein n=1 Tax=Cichlidogyrus casuarinus TaxID=1844966 RepID=A0ABD2PTT1_9PLAT